MHYGEIKNCDIANGPGVRVSLFVSGCTNRCENCFQPQTWDFHYGREFTAETEEYIIGLMKPGYIAGITILGGEPFEPSNQRTLLPLVKRIREIYPAKNVWYFSGFTYEELTDDGAHPHCEATEALLALGDVLGDGRYVEEKRNISLRFRGSENQRLIDLPATRKNGAVTLWDE